jgi:two-component system response regulator AtoC
VVKPFDPEELALRLKQLVESERLRDRVRLAGGGEQTDLDSLGSTARMVELRRQIEKIADTPSTILITGESGTGKEVIARLVHRLSRRADGPFVAVNMGGIPEGLLESELFGHERGAFTGAERRKPGMFELAASGTLFLDEIGEMPPHLQVKLLRVLQDRRIQRLGATEPIPVDVRIIAATNRDLAARVSEGRFREDLFYRLNVIHLEVPPLRERPEDIPLITARLIARINARLGRAVRSVEPEAMRRLQSYGFPGNVRELENLIERAIIFAEGEALRAFDLQLEHAVEGPPPRPASLRSLEREAIVSALHRWEGNRTRAAEELGISRRTLLNKINQYGLGRKSTRDGR